MLLHTRDCLACFSSSVEAPTASLGIRATHLYSPRVLWKSFRAASNFGAGRVKPMTAPVRAWWPARLTSMSRGSQSCFGLLILSHVTNKPTLSKLEALTRPFATRLSFPRGLAVRNVRSRLLRISESRQEWVHRSPM